MKTFFEGLLAGYGIAIPVGGIAILILDIALRKGFRRGFFAGAGAATADLLGALAVAAAGGIVANALAPFSSVLRVGSGLALVAMGAYGLWRIHLRTMVARGSRAEEGGDLRTYLQFIALTIVNPLTVAYFAALVLGRGADELSTWTARAAFVGGFFLASLSWQTLLAAFGAVTHRFVPAGAQLLISVLGNVIVIGLGARMLLRSFS